MDDKSIKEIDENLFRIKLKFLNIKAIKLKYIKTNLFSKLYNLIELDISNNSLLLIEPYSMINLEKLENLIINDNENLSLNIQSLVGLNSIENVYLEVLLNETKKQNLINSINLSISAIIMDRIYYKSINIVATHDKNKTKGEKECGLILYFLKLNYFLNLKTEQEISDFLNICNKIK